MAIPFESDIDLKGALLLDGNPGEVGQIPYSAGPGQPATWGEPPGGGGGSVGIDPVIAGMIF